MTLKRNDCVCMCVKMLQRSDILNRDVPIPDIYIGIGHFWWYRLECKHPILCITDTTSMMSLIAFQGGSEHRERHGPLQKCMYHQKKTVDGQESASSGDCCVSV